MNRDDALTAVRESPADWDVLVIGGGATGLGAAVEAAARGYRTVLLEQSDFAGATSSRSTKLIHGGFRYLRQGNISLVLDSLRERGLLLRNAPHLVHTLSFIVPNYAWWEAPYYGAGLKLYDWLAGRHGLGPSKHLSRNETLELLPTLEAGGLRGGIRYFDCQFDDARLAICLAQTLADLGGWAVNYLHVDSLLKHNGRVCGVRARDLETQRECEIRARVVINATGVFTDAVRRMDDVQAPGLMVPSQGAHIVLPTAFLPGDSALMVPKTADDRVLFAIPWHDRVLVGTTDTPVEETPLEPRPLEAEIKFLLEHAGLYLAKDPAESDILSAFAGLRPLVKSGAAKSTARLSRDHIIVVSPSGLVTVAGGKWTTYRKMGEDVVDKAAAVAGLEPRPSRTRELRLHGWMEPEGGRQKAGGNQRELGSPSPRPSPPPGAGERVLLPAAAVGQAGASLKREHFQNREDWLAPYGSDAEALRTLMHGNPGWAEMLHPKLPWPAVAVLWGVRREMARNVEDVLARRLRALVLDARTSMEIAPKVAALMAKELGRDKQWEQQQVSAYRELAKGYLPGGCT